jgi:hypothetical protein
MAERQKDKKIDRQSLCERQADRENESKKFKRQGMKAREGK